MIEYAARVLELGGACRDRIGAYKGLFDFTLDRHTRSNVILLLI